MWQSARSAPAITAPHGREQRREVVAAPAAERERPLRHRRVDQEVAGRGDGQPDRPVRRPRRRAGRGQAQQGGHEQEQVPSPAHIMLLHHPVALGEREPARQRAAELAERLPVAVAHHAPGSRLASRADHSRKSQVADPRQVVRELLRRNLARLAVDPDGALARRRARRARRRPGSRPRARPSTARPMPADHRQAVCRAW